MAFDKDKTLASAQKYADKGQFEKAIREYMKVVEADGEDDRTLLELSRCYENSGKTSEAVETYQKVAQLYRARGAYQKALAVLKQAQKSAPDDDEIAIFMAELSNALGLGHEAVQLLEKCLSRSEETGNRRGYSKILQMMVRFDSENLTVRLKYAKMLLDDGDRDGAIRQYSLTLAMLLSKERYADYIQTSREYLKLNPNDDEVIEELANIYVRMERFNEALSVFGNVEPSERSSRMREMSVTCYTRMNRPREALIELKQLAHYYEEDGRTDLAEDAWRRAQKIAPADREIQMALSGGTSGYMSLCEDDLPMAEVLDDEPPFLSDSALNVVSVGMGQEPVEEEPEVYQQEREIAAQFTQAMDAYRRGMAGDASMMCLQILELKDSYMPALQLLLQIYENQQDEESLALIERKIARAIFETGETSEAIRHVLKAEKYTPRSWDNYNMLLSFGVEPGQYGLVSPDNLRTSSTSNARIPAALMASGYSSRITSERTPVPSQMPSSCPPVPPAMSSAGATPSAPSAAVPPAMPSVPPSMPSAAVPPAMPSVPPSSVMPVMPPSVLPSAVSEIQPVVSSALPSAPPVPPSVRPKSSSVNERVPEAAPSVSVPSAIAPKSMGTAVLSSEQPQEDASSYASAVSNEDLDEVFGGIFGKAPEKPSVPVPQVPPRSVVPGRPSGLPGRVPSVPARQPSVTLPPVSSQIRMSVPPAGVPGVKRNSTINGPVGVGLPPAKPIIAPKPAVMGGSFAQNPAESVPVVNECKVSDDDMVDYNVGDMIDDDLEATPVSPVEGVEEDDAAENMPYTGEVVPITDENRARISEQLQEIEFFASLMLLDDARRLLQGLIDRHGDVDMIHEMKVKLDSLG